MRKWLPVIVIALVFVSCEKSSSTDNTPDPPDPPATKLVKTVEKTGADSVTTEYFYDANERMIRFKVSGAVAGTSKYYETWLTRNANGAITQEINKGAQLTSMGIDSQLTVYVYNVPGNRPSFSRLTFMDSGVFFKDSTAYEYDGAGNIVRDYHNQYMAPNPVQRFSMVYVRSANGNIDSTNYYDYDPATGGYTPGPTIAFQYDTKKNPLKLGIEGVLLYSWEIAGPNNPTQEKAVYPNSVPSADYTVNISYTYRSDNLPVAATKTRTPGGTSTITYYYQ
jgi:hypothetical protein